MVLFKQKKGDLIANIFMVIFGLIIFFALYPTMSSLLNIGVSMHADDTSAGFLILAIPWIILLGVVVWSYRTVIGGGGGTSE